ncbi:MAG: thioesterase family protein [Dehalococcoidia bacterium]|nr:thioesterase family protein [Dehalococcoidia bacterium]
MFQASLSFTRPDEGVDEHQAPMPEAPDPEGLEAWGWPGIDRANDDERKRWLRKRPVEIRDADTDGSLRGGEVPRRKVWIRMKGELPESEAIHAAAIAYATDSGLLSTARGVNAPGRRASASLDHSVWFHYPPRFGDWLLYTSENPIAHAARALIFGQMHRPDGTHVVSVAQEGTIGALVQVPGGFGGRRFVHDAPHDDPVGEAEGQATSSDAASG